MVMAAAQPELAGIEPAPVQTPANDVPRIAINGRLVSHAITRVKPGPVIVLEALIEQRVEHHPRALRWLCRHQLADAGSFEETRQHAEALLRHLRAGVEVMAVGRGAEIRSHLGEDVFSLLNCDAIGSIAAAERRGT